MLKRNNEIEGYIITVPEPKFFELKNDAVKKGLVYFES